MVLINTEMPKCCAGCPLYRSEGAGYWSCSILEKVEDGIEVKSWKNRRKDCPLVEYPQHGEWVDNHTTCSVCGWQMIDDVTESRMMVGFMFCPGCGADMRRTET